MIRRPSPIHTYNNGQPYRPARGRHAEQPSVEHHQFHGHPIIQGFPTNSEFSRAAKRELKIRCYSQSSIKNYTSCINSFLRWFGAAPHQIDIEDVRNYLEILIDGGADSSTISGNLSAIRTCFDKFCGRDITLGLVTPRRRKSQPVILSPEEVMRIIHAAPNFTMKLAIGIMYAAGLRNKELCRLRVEDLDFDRNTIRVFQGKGRTDRLVMMPETFRNALKEICADRPGTAYLFPSLDHRKNRYMSPRTLQRWVKVCAGLAGIKKTVTPHSFRHSFATHLLENGTDIRYIQKLLGHQRLETTTIYTRVAQIKTQKITSPLDQIPNSQLPQHPTASTPHPPTPLPPQPNYVGKLSLKVTLRSDKKSADVDLSVLNREPISLPGIIVIQSDRNWLEIKLPPIDHWNPLLNKLPDGQRERIQSPEFYETLRALICERFLYCLTQSASPPPPT